MVKLGKPFNSLGDTPGEFIGNLILLIIIGPVYLIILLLVYLWGLIGMLLHFPSPKKIPVVVKDDNLSTQDIFNTYRNKFSEVLNTIEGLKKHNEDGEIVYTSLKAKVTLSYDDDSVYINIEGLDTGYWHTSEEGNIDLYFWASVAALRNGIRYKKSRWGRSEGWFYSNEMLIWMGVSTGGGEKHRSTYHKFARKM